MWLPVQIVIAFAQPVFTPPDVIGVDPGFVPSTTKHRRLLSPSKKAALFVSSGDQTSLKEMRREDAIHSTNPGLLLVECWWLSFLLFFDVPSGEEFGIRSRPFKWVANPRRQISGNQAFWPVKDQRSMDHEIFAGL